MKTSYSIPLHLFELLEHASEKTGVSKPKLLKRCFLKQIRYMHKARILHGNVVLYNERDKGWKLMNLCWDEKEYAIVHQCRFYMRYSISKLMAMSLRK